MDGRDDRHAIVVFILCDASDQLETIAGMQGADWKVKASVQ
jgi:hypothetical protein